MSKFTLQVTKIFHFDGDNITVTFARLKRGDAYNIFASEQENDTIRGKMLLDLVPAYVKQMTGVTDSNGNPLTMDDIKDEVYFLPLLREISQALFEASNLGKTETGNSPAQPVDALPDSTSETAS